MDGWVMQQINAYKTSVSNIDRKGHHLDLDIDGRIILKYILNITLRYG
jgi:hypothetical protein